MDRYKQSLHEVLDKRHKALIERADRYIKRARGAIPGLVEDFDKTWLKQFTVGNGLDVACGDFPMATGVDIRMTSVGADFFCAGDDLHFQPSNELDFIVCNWLDAFATPLKALEEWHRCLKPGGTLAVVCRNALVYENQLGPLESQHWISLFCKKTLSMYMFKAGFTEVVIEEHGDALRAKAVK